jgi:hypothetical protein
MSPRPKLDIDGDRLRVTYPEFGAQAELRWSDVTAFAASCVPTPSGHILIFSLIHQNGESLELNDDIPKFDRRIDEIAAILNISPLDLDKLRRTLPGRSHSIRIK